VQRRVIQDNLNRQVCLHSLRKNGVFLAFCLPLAAL
jgi:hypothetical protein